MEDQQKENVDVMDEFRILREGRFRTIIAQDAPMLSAVARCEKIVEHIAAQHPFRLKIARVLASHLYGAPFSNAFEKIQKLLPVLEKCMENGTLNEAMDVAEFIWNYQASRAELKDAQSGRIRTEHAHQKFKFLRNNDKTGDKLMPFFQKVEDQWHPRNNSDKPTVRPAKSRKRAIEIVFRTEENKIREILGTDLDKEELEKLFCKYFDQFTELCYLVNKHTLNGYEREERAPRTETSKENSRNGARKRRLKK